MAILLLSVIATKAKQLHLKLPTALRSMQGDHGMTLNLSYRGVALPVRAHALQTTLRVTLMSSAIDAYEEACKQSVPDKYPPWPEPPALDALLQLVIHGMEAARHAPTPAFNLHDHFMLAGAVAAAAQMAPESFATNVEVGAFAGHTAIFQAALLKKLTVVSGKVHAVDASQVLGSTDFGRHTNVRRAGFESSIILHESTSANMSGWQTPLRLFFEDSRHNYVGASSSFDAFESSLLTGGILVLHDVVCCQKEFPSLMKFVQERVLDSGMYRELFFPAPQDWRNLSKLDASKLLSALRDSVDQRPGYTERMMSRYGSPLPCSQLCEMRTNVRYMSGGYHWSLCPNVRVFQKLPARTDIDPLLSLVSPFGHLANSSSLCAAAV